MNDNSANNDIIIVIGRQFGCGGRKIGKRIAEAFGIPYYDKTLLSEASREHGYSPTLFHQTDERRPSFFRNFLGLQSGTTFPASLPGTLSHETLYQQQSEVIRSICKKGSCVIVGRTADYVMRDHPGIVSLFIHAPLDFRIKKIIDRGDAADRREAEDLARRFDRTRESYYNYFTNRRWGTADNYHLCFDASKFDADAIVALIKSHIQSRR